MQDPRVFQISVLASLLAYGLGVLGFDQGLGSVAALLASAVATQLFWAVVRREAFDPRSALISGLSLCLLLRSNSLAVDAGVACLAVSSKYLLRWNGKHLFNPTAFGLALAVFAGEGVWLSSGQWGSAAWLTVLLACGGSLVVGRARRSDVTWAFLASYGLLLFGRALWLGDPLTVPLHAIQSGAFLLFAFFMISDPRTGPASRPGRLIFAVAVAGGAFVSHYGFYEADGALISLLACSLFVPWIDARLPGRRFEWSIQADTPKKTENQKRRKTMPWRIPVTRIGQLGCLLLFCFLVPMSAQAFCGFYAAKADTKIFNKASQVVLVRDGNRNVVTMVNDFKGEPKEFALVVPVPTVLAEGQIHVGEKAVIDHLDAYTSPRLVEYFDPNPCEVGRYAARDAAESTAAPSEAKMSRRPASSGVTIEASYTVGEYDILILSAEESAGLARWLQESGYRLPDGASRVLGSYLKQGMRFFVAKVNLKEHSKLGFSSLRPLQIAYESAKFMLPIRLGTLNADGQQELFVYTLTRTGRVETTNYRTVKLPTGQGLPVHLKRDFADFYRAMFTEQTRRENGRAVFLEYAWDMNWCDPCAADPLTKAELRELGVFWLDVPGAAGRGRVAQAADVFVTRLHVRYDKEHFPDDLRFQETGDRSNFQGRYVLRHAYTGGAECSAMDAYRQALADRHEREAKQLAHLTGWELSEIHRAMGREPGASGKPAPAVWWEGLWQRFRD